jgi:hypothetical protein
MLVEDDVVNGKEPVLERIMRYGSFSLGSPGPG